jgi:ATP-dependent protease ClpP protease subunit
MRLIQNGELILFGAVGDPTEGFTDTDVVAALATLDPESALTVRINSGGGFADQGVAIYNALMQHPGRVTVRVDGVAASAASLIAMAGDEIVAMTGALMMIHDPALVTVGTVDEHNRGMHQLDKTAAAMASIYANRTGKSLPAIRAAMAAELWMTAAEAVAEGYADRVGSGTAKAAASFNYGLYARAPTSLTGLAAADAKARSETPQGRAGAAGWRRLVKARNIAAGFDEPDKPSLPPDDDGRSAMIRGAAAARGNPAFGEALVGAKITTAAALKAITLLPAPVVDQAEASAGWSRAVEAVNARRAAGTVGG